MARSKFPATFAALTLIGASVFAGGLVAANAQAEAPVIVSPETAATSTDLYPFIAGTIANSGEQQTITVTVENLAGTGVYCTAVIPYTDTEWSCGYSIENFGLQYGENIFTATAVDESDPASPSIVSNTVVVTIGGEQDVSMFAPAPGATVHDASPFFEGFGPVLGVARVYVGGEAEMCSATIEISGYWSCESTFDLPEGGPYDIAATSTLITGGTSPAFWGPQALYYVAPPPAPTISSPASGTSTYSSATTFSGTIPNPGGQRFTVIVYRPSDGNIEMCRVTVEGETTWTCDAALEPGTVDYFATAYFESEGPDTSNPSLTSNTTSVTYLGSVPLPVMDYALGAASIGITGTGLAGSEVASRFYEAVWNGEGYSHNVISNCPPGGAVPHPTPISCSFADLGPGIYNSYTYQSIDGFDSEYVDDYIMIPATPTLDAALGSDSLVEFSGSGTPGYVVFVETTGGDAICSGTVSAGELWQCSSAQTVGPHDYQAVQQSQGFVADTGLPGNVGSFQGYSAYTAVESVTVPGPPAVPTPTITTASGTTYEDSALVEGTVVNADSVPLVIVVTSTGSEGTDSCNWSTSSEIWGCSVALEPGNNTITAVSYLEGEGGAYGDPSGASNEIVISRDALPKPTMNYTPGPASIVVSGQALPGGELDTSFFSVTVPPSLEYQYAIIDTCDIGGGEGGPESFECTYTDLAPGIYNSYTGQVVGGAGSDYQNDYLIIPSTPTLSAIANDDDTATFSGTGTPGYLAFVETAGGSAVCDDVVSTGSTWSCTAPAASGDYRAGQLAQGWVADTGVPSDVPDLSIQGYSAFTELVNVTFGPAPVPPTPTITTAPDSTYAGFASIEGTLVNPGGAPLLVEVTATSGEGAQTCLWYTNTEYFGCSLSLGAGTNTITAVAYFDDEVLGAPGATSNAIEITRVDVPKPTVQYTLGPASVTISGLAILGGDIYTTFYRVDPTGGEGGYGYTGLGDCGTDSGGEGGSEFAVGDFGCTFSNLAPGIYNSYTNQQVEFASSNHQNDYLIIPSTPTLAGIGNPDGTATFTGSGTPGYLAYVETPDGAAVCQTVVPTDGAWSCSGAAVTGDFRAGQRAQGWAANTGSESDVPDLSIQGYSAYTGLVAVTVPQLPTLTPPPPPAAPTTPVTPPAPTTPTTPPAAVLLPIDFAFAAGGTEFEPGDGTVLTGAGLPAGAAIGAEFHSIVVTLGSTVVAEDGTFSLPVSIPTDATPGLHHFVVTLTPLVGPPSTREQAVTVKLPVKATDSPSKAEVAEALALMGGDGEGGTGSVDRTDPAAPSSLTQAIPAVTTILSNPVVLGVAAVAGLILLLLVAIPAELLNSTISEQYPRFAKRLPRLTWTQRLTAWLERVPIVGGIGLTVLAAFIFGFTDPNFGFDLVSLRVVLACALALFVVGYLASVISGSIIRRRWGLATAMELKPLGIILAVVGVVISRLIDFSPGFMLGLILGIALVGNTTIAQRAKATLVQGGVVFVLAMLGWVAYSVLSATTAPDSFFTTLMFDTSVAITTEGLTALAVGMLPFRFLDGEVVFQYNKVLWAASFVVAALAFVTIVVPNSYGELDTDGGTWLLVVGIFAALALGIWAYFRFFARPYEDDEEEEQVQEKVDA